MKMKYAVLVLSVIVTLTAHGEYNLFVCLFACMFVLVPFVSGFNCSLENSWC